MYASDVVINPNNSRHDFLILPLNSKTSSRIALLLACGPRPLMSPKICVFSTTLPSIGISGYKKDDFIKQKPMKNSMSLS